MKREESTLPHHRRQRSTIEAIAYALPPQAQSFTGSAAAAAYLAALVSSLQRYVATSEPVHLSNARSENPRKQRLSRKQLSERRLQQSRAQNDVVNLPVFSLLAPEAHAQPPAMNGSAAESHEMCEDDSEDPQANQCIGVVASVVSLIAMAAQGSTNAFLNLKGVHVLEVVLSAYNHVSGYVSVAHHTNALIAAVLSVLAAPAWSSPTVQSAFLYLLRHTSDSDESFRLNSCKVLNALLQCPRGNLIATKVSGVASSFIIDQSSKLLQAVQDDSASDATRTAFCNAHRLLMASADNYGGFLLPSDAARVAGELVALAIKHIAELSHHAYLALSAFFMKKRSPSQETVAKDFSSPLLLQSDISKLLTVIHSQRLPEECADDLLLAHATCVATGTAAFVSYFEHTSPPDDLILRPVRVLFDAIDPSRGRSPITKTICRNFQLFLGNRWFFCKPRILFVLQRAMDKKHSPVWGDVIPVLRTYLENGMCAGNELMRDPVKAIVDSCVSMREKALEEEDSKAQDVAQSLLKAICRGGGVSLLLSAVPVRYDKKLHVSNGWVLAVMRGNVVGGALSTFSKNLLPVAEELDTVMRERKEQKRVIEAKNIDIYKAQICALLPGFCTKPSDLMHDGVMTEAFKVLYSCLASDSGESLFATGVSALRQLSLSVSSLSSVDPTCREKVDAFASRFKKLFPTVAELVEKAEDSKRSVLLSAVTLACKATDNSELVSQLLRKSIRKMLDLKLKLMSEDVDDMTDEGEESIRAKQHAAADMASALAESRMIPLDANEIGFLNKALTPYFDDSRESSLQKKAYRLSTMLINSGMSTKDSTAFLGLVKSTALTFNNLAAGAKANRLAWISAVVNQALTLSEQQRAEYLDQMNYLFLSEVLLSTRGVSAKCRAAAFETLVNLARGWNSFDEEKGGGLGSFILTVSAGLGGKTDAMLACTLSCIGQIVRTFRYEIVSSIELRNLVDSLFVSVVHGGEKMEDGEDGGLVQPGPIAILLRHSSVEVQRAAVDVIKIATKCCNEPRGRLLSLVSGFLPGLLHVAAGSNKRETRLRVRLVLERLMRKCGFDEVERIFPEEHMPLLLAVRKEYRRELSKKLAAKEKRSQGWGGKTEERGFKLTSEDAGHVEHDTYESDSDDEDKLLGGGNDSSMKGKSGNGSGANTGDVVDLLECKSGLIGVGTGSGRGGVKKAALKRSEGKKRDSGKEVKYSDDGKPIFVESEDESANAEAGSAKEDDGDSSDDEKRREAKKITGKRKMADRDGEARNSKKLKGSFGEEYRGKRGRGDVKRAGRPDPFAYVPLGASMFAPGRRPGESGKAGRGTALDKVVNSSSSSARRRRRGPGGRAGVPGRR